MTYNMEEFSRQIETARWRVAGLERQASEALQAAPDLLPSAIEELHVAFEELQVTQEEILLQQNELASVRSRIEAERQRYHDLFEFAPDAYVVTTANGTIREANRVAAAMLGRPQSSLVGMSLALFVPDDARQGFRQNISRLRQAEAVQQWEARIQPHQGGAFDAAIAVAPTRDWGARTVNLRWVLRDISSQKQAEERINALEAQIEQRVHERTAQLSATIAEQQVELQRERARRAAAEQAVHERESFMAVVAHELKAPLAAIIGYAQLLQRRIQVGDTLKSRDLRGLRTIVDSAQQLTKMIDLLQDLTQIESGQLSIDRMPLDIAALARHTAEMLSGMLKGHRLEMNCPEAPLVIEGDEQRLRQVIQNLLQNAVKYSPQGQTITVRLERVDDQARLLVRDRGIGIPEAARDAIFERFYRAGNADQQQIGGMGIGLYVVKEIITLHGGRIEIESEVGTGSTFTVWLPLAQNV
jgi:PAS domain S-box-containing protein